MFAFILALATSHKKDECNSCISMTKTVSRLVKFNFNEEMIANEISKICNLYKLGDAEFCKAYYESHLKEIIKLLRNHETATKICYQLDYCKVKRAPQTNDDVTPVFQTETEIAWSQSWSQQITL